jgi:sodium-dependent dicarboxylate transporter 2/3/5
MGKAAGWDQASKIPWGVLLLFAGGICIAKAFAVSGLSVALGAVFDGLAVLPIFAMLLVLSLAVSFMTESTSNTATTVLLMPILAAAALAAKLDPQMLMIPAALSASCAFMLPVATAPNAIIFGSGKVRSIDMLRTGFLLNIVGALIITTICYVLL